MASTMLLQDKQLKEGIVCIPGIQIIQESQRRLNYYRNIAAYVNLFLFLLFFFLLI